MFRKVLPVELRYRLLHSIINCILIVPDNSFIIGWIKYFQVKFCIISWWQFGWSEEWMSEFITKLGCKTKIKSTHDELFTRIFVGSLKSRIQFFNLHKLLYHQNTNCLTLLKIRLWFAILSWNKWCSGYHYCTASLIKDSTQVLHRFKSCSQHVRDLRWWGSLTMVMAVNKAKHYVPFVSQLYYKNNSSS